MTYEELQKKIEEVLPGCSFDEDNYGQIIIYTNLMEIEYTDGRFEVVKMEEEDFEDDED